MAERGSEKGLLLFASDDSRAEKAREEEKGEGSGLERAPTSSNKPLRITSKTSLADAVIRRQDDAIDFREDAKVWYLYLEDAEREAKERAELWRTGLDSLLIFAGLFAGVVSSFVIDARPDLHTDSEQRLLGDIREVLGSGSISEALKIPVSARLISALWGLSLYITLFGSIMGVLAKAWLAKFVPATARREAKDAYQRYALDQQAERWFLREVLTLVPLLVQIASFLFLIGFVLQSYEDDLTIGHIIAVFCATGGLLYLMMTVLPLFVSTAPFDTPFSDFLLWGRDLALAIVRRRPFAELPGQVKQDINEGLAEILYYKLIKSPKQAHVDEAIAEVASTMFKDRWIVFLCQTETPQILLARFRYCAATSDMPTEQRNETLRNCLMALLRFAETYEREVGHKIQEGSAIPEEYRILATALRDSLEPENPLHRWNRLPEDLRPLLFSVRAAVLKLMPLSQVTDFSFHELSDRPWEMALQDIHSGHRFHFVLAACSGIFQDQPNLKIVSAAMLALSLSRAASSTIESGRITEWTGILHASERERVYELAPLLLSKLQDVTARRWEDLILESELAASEIPSQSAQRRSRLLVFLIDCLGTANADWELQCHAVHLLEHFSQLPDDQLQDVKTLIREHALDDILDIAIQAMGDDEHPETSVKAMRLLVNLSLPDYGMHKLVQEKIIRKIKEGVDGDLYYSLGRQTVEFVSSCFRGLHVDLFYDWFPKILPDLVRFGLKDYPSDYVLAVWEFLPTELPSRFNVQAVVPNYNEVLKQHILDEIKAILDGTDGWRQYHILQTILRFLRDGFPPNDGLSTTPTFAFPWATPEDLVLDIIEPSFTSILKVASSGYDVMGSGAAQEILRRASTFALSSRIPMFDALDLLESSVISSSLYEQRRAALDIMHWLRLRLNLENPVIYKRLLETGCNSADDDSHIRLRCLELVKIVLEEVRDMTEEAAEIIKSTVASNSSQILSESDLDIQEAWVDLLGAMSKHASLLGTVPLFLNMLAKGFGHSSRTVKDYFAEDPIPGIESEPYDSGLDEPQTPHVKLVPDSDLRDAIAKGIPQDIHVSFSAPEEWERVGQWLKLLLALQHLDGFSGIGDDIFDLAIKAVNGTVETICGDTERAAQDSQATQGDTPKAKATPSQLLANIQQGDRTAWVQILAHLVQHSPKDLPWAPAFILRLAVEDTDDEVRNACITSLIPLVELDEIREPLSRHLTEHFTLVGEKGNADVRASLAILVRSFGNREPSPILDTLVHALLNYGWDDTDSEVRHQAIAALFKLASGEEGRSYGKLIAQGTFETKYEASIANPDSNSWRWLHLKARWLHGQESHNISRLLDTSFQLDTPYDLFAQTESDVLADLLQQASHRELTASTLAQALVAAIRKSNPEIRDRAYALLGTLFSTTDLSDIPSLYYAGELWLDIVVFLSRTDEFQIAVKILERGLKDIPKDGFLFLSTVSDTVKLLEPLPAVLSRALAAALKSDSSSNEELRAAGVNLFACLLDPTKGLENAPSGGSPSAIPDHLRVNASSYVTLLGRQNDALVISRLVESYMKERDYLRQISAEAALEKTVRFQSAPGEARFSSLVKSALSKAIDVALLDTNVIVRSNAVRVIDSLTVRLSDDGTTVSSANFFRDEVVCFSLPQLLKMALVEMGGNTSSTLRMDARTLIRNHISKVGGFGSLVFSNALWTAIPSLIPAITVDGKETILELATSDGRMSSEAAASVARALVPVFRDGSSFARSAAIDLLSSLYSKHRENYPALIDFTVPEIVAFALDDNDDVGTLLRATAISLLVSILTAVPSISDPAFNQISPQAMKFMALLKSEGLRSPTVKLMSILALDSRIRKVIAMRIVNSVISTVKANEAMEIYAELLSQLVVESRFLDEPTDYLVLNLLPTILGRQQFAPFRTIMLTSLWCWYGQSLTSIHEATSYSTDLVEWLKYTFFGRHATGYEVKMWSARCHSWLSAEGVDIEKNAESTMPQEQGIGPRQLDTPHDVGGIQTAVPSDDVLLFDQWVFGELALESPHPVIYQGESYPTASHLVEAIKYLPDRPHIARFFQSRPQEDVSNLPYLSGGYNSWKRQDWDSVAASKLEEVLMSKFKQHIDLTAILLDQTHDSELVYRSADSFLGDAYGAGGQNELGKALMKVRSQLRKEREAQPNSDEAQSPS